MARIRTIAVLTGLALTLSGAFAGSAAAIDGIQVQSVTAIPEQRPMDIYAQYGGVGGYGTPDDPTDNSSATIPDMNQAGAHPALNVDVQLCPPPPTEGPCPNGDDLKDLLLRFPPGLIGNPENLDKCTTIEFNNDLCPPSSRIGWLFADSNLVNPGGEDDYVSIQGEDGPGDLYNLEPGPSEVALIGARIDTKFAVPGGSTVHLPVLISVNATGDFEIEQLTPNNPEFIHIPGSPEDASPIQVRRVMLSLFGYAGNPPKPFITMPTQCDGGDYEVEANSHEHPGLVSSNSYPIKATGCENVPFTPGFGFTQSAAGTTQAGAPSGYDVEITFPNSEADPIHQAHLKKATVKLPQGVTLAAAAGAGLEGCTAAQFGKGSDAAAACPPGSKIGDVEIQTPVLDQPLTGEAYFAKPNAPGGPTQANPWQLYMQIAGKGLRIKLAGDVTVDPNTGQITNVFSNLPQTPFTSFKLTLAGGDRAILQNPGDCSAHQGEVTLEGWNGKQVVVTPTVTPTGCASPQAFGPTVDSVSAEPSQAGAHSASHIVISRPDFNQNLSSIQLALPPGAVGSLKAVPLCGAAQIAAGTCNEASQIGKVEVQAGVGAQPLNVTGRLYIGQPLVGGDAASIGLVIPAKAGPIDLGNVVVTNRVTLDKHSAQISVATSTIPTALAGIPLPVKRVQIDVDRPGFFRNPTGCDPRTLGAAFFSDQGASAPRSAVTQATGCGALPFHPNLRLIAEAKGQTDRFDHTGLRAIVTQTEGEGNITKARVQLPDIIRPDTVPLNQPGGLCQEAQLLANACPGPSLVGSAVAHSPLLPTPLSGPVYIVQHPGNILPKLAVQLGGMVSIQLDAQNELQGFRTINRFDSVPDVAVSRFELFIRGGKGGILKNFNDLCEPPKNTDVADATFTSHSGAQVHFKPTLEVPACASSSAGARLSISSKRARVDKKGRVKIKVRCRGAQRCKGRLTLKGKVRKGRRGKPRNRTLARKSFSIPAGKTKTVKAKLNGTARRALKRSRKRRLRAKATATASGASTGRRTLTIQGRRH